MVISYQQTDIRSLNVTYDVVYDVAVSSSFRRCAHLLEHDGVFVSNIATPGSLIASGLYPVLSLLGCRKRNTFAFVVPSGQDLRDLSEYLRPGAVWPVIDRVFALEQLAEAHRYLQESRGAGKVVIRVGVN